MEVPIVVLITWRKDITINEMKITVINIKFSEKVKKIRRFKLCSNLKLT